MRPEGPPPHKFSESFYPNSLGNQDFRASLAKRQWVGLTRPEREQPPSGRRSPFSGAEVSLSRCKVVYKIHILEYLNTQGWFLFLPGRGSHCGSENHFFWGKGIYVRQKSLVSRLEESSSGRSLSRMAWIGWLRRRKAGKPSAGTIHAQTPGHSVRAIHRPASGPAAAQ